MRRNAQPIRRRKRFFLYIGSIGKFIKRLNTHSENEKGFYKRSERLKSLYLCRYSGKCAYDFYIERKEFSERNSVRYLSATQIKIADKVR